MADRKIFALLVALFVPLAGCFSDDEDLASDPATAQGTDVDLGRDGNVTNLTASAPDDLTGGHAPHIHNYWGDSTRLVTFDGPVRVEILSRETFFSVIGRKEGSVGGTRWELPEGKTVYEGTGVIVMTASWTDATITGIGMAYKPPTEAETADSYRDVVPLQNGVPLELEVTPEMTDMPHEAVSRWGFLFDAGGTPGVAQGTFNLKFEIVRVRDVMKFPGHPDMYEDTDHYVLADKPFRYENPSFASFFLEYAIDKRREVLTPDTGVPMETRFLILELTIDSASASAPIVESQGLDLFYRGADGERHRADPLSVEGNVWTFGLPVTDAQVDSPYTDVSAWRFGPLAKQAVAVAGVNGPDCQFCFDFEVSGHAVITAYDADPTGGSIRPSEPVGRR